MGEMSPVSPSSGSAFGMLASQEASPRSPSPSRPGYGRASSFATGSGGSDLSRSKSAGDLSEDSQAEKEQKQKMMQAEFQTLLSPSGTRIQVSDRPAPYLPPDRQKRRPPASVMPKSAETETTITRMIRSSVGRFCTMCWTLILFASVSTCSIMYREESVLMQGQAYLVVLLGCVLVVALFAGMPALARVAGMGTTVKGVDFKPYFVCYRLGYFLMIPALFLLYYSYGEQVSFGAEALGENGGAIYMGNLTATTRRWFRARDGFVGLNLTKGVTELVYPVTHGTYGSNRTSKFLDSQLQVNKEPFAAVPVPTVHPGALKLYRVAPIFETWEGCLAGYMVSQFCLGRNKVVAWAMSRSRSWCSTISSVGCRSPLPLLEPTYRCWTDTPNNYADDGSIQGLCGRIVAPPPLPVIDELGALYTLDGWEAKYLPSPDAVWVDVSHDPCINDPEACEAEWAQRAQLGFIFVACFAVLTFIPMYLDCKLDAKIRTARKIYFEGERSGIAG